MADPEIIAGLAVLGGVGLDIIKTQINNLLSPTTEHFGKVAKERLQEIFRRTTKKLHEQNVKEVRAVPDKVVAPILQNSVLEQDDDMKERWANMLKSALDAKNIQAIPPSFPKILGEMSPEEASIIDRLYGLNVEGRNPEAVYPNVAFPVSGNFVFTNGNDFAMKVNNLERLGLLKVDYGMTANKQAFPRFLQYTKLGFAFACAVWTPGREPEHLDGGFAPELADSMAITMDERLEREALIQNAVPNIWIRVNPTAEGQRQMAQFMLRNDSQRPVNITSWGYNYEGGGEISTQVRGFGPSNTVDASKLPVVLEEAHSCDFMVYIDRPVEELKQLFVVDAQNRRYFASDDNMTAFIQTAIRFKK